MPDFEVLLSNKAEKGLSKADYKIKSRLIEVLDTLETDPVPSKKFDVTKLSGSKSNYRIKIIPYRILYSINWESKQINVYDIDRRKDRTYK